MQTTLRNCQENTGFQAHRVILIGGSARAAAESALAAGLRVAAIDRFGDQDLRANVHQYRHWRPEESLLDPLRSLLAVDPQIPTAVVLVGGAESAIKAVEAARRQLESSSVRFLTPSAQQIRRGTDPACLQSIAHRSGIDFPDWQPSLSLDFLPSQRWLSKPRIRCGGLSVRDYQGVSASEAKTEHYLQRYVQGQLLGVSYCADSQGSQCLGVCLGRTHSAAAAPFSYAGSIGPVSTPTVLQTTLLRLGSVIHDTLGLQGLFGVDLICTGVRLYLLEINMRYCASMELLDSDAVNCLQLHCQSFESPLAAVKPVGLKVPPQPVRCKRIVYARRALVWDQTKQQRLETFRQQHEQGRDAAGHVACRDRPCVGTTIDAGEPLLTLRTQADSATEAWRRATRTMIKLRRLLGI